MEQRKPLVSINGRVRQLPAGDTLPAAALSIKEFGKAWANVSAARAINTTYTNTSAVYIMVFVTVNSNTTGAVQVGDVTLSFVDYNTSSTTTMSFIVPPGVTYRVTPAGSPSIISWLELL